MKKNLVVVLFISLFLMSCAEVQPNISSCLNGSAYGFFGGLWHGIILPFSFIGSLIFDDISIYAINNNGGWYNFGFMLGIGFLGSYSKLKQ